MTVTKLPGYIQVNGKRWSAVYAKDCRGRTLFVGKRLPVPPGTPPKPYAPTFGFEAGWWA